MHKIQKLPPHEAQKIAAGEVVERPANLLKELLENAIDAQSNKISIYIKDGGKSLIRVVDNGCGMSSEDAQLCFEQHATSKITHVDQLQNIHTFGFRGEALASIAAIGKTTLITKESSADYGTKILVEENNIIKTEQISAVDGTDISIHDIFYNLPARQKFLKKRETEWRQIQQLFFAIALAHLSIDFKLYSQDALLYHCKITDSLAQRWQQLFSHDTAKQMIQTEHKDTAAQIKGLISDHQLQRYDRNNIHLFVNNRWVKDNKLTRAFIKGYQNVLLPARYPVGCLFITLDPHEVDINIHPRKEEVQFLHPRRVERTIKTCITQSLEKQLSAQLNKTVQIKQESPFETQAHTQPAPTYPTLKQSTDFSPFNFDTFLNQNAFNPDVTEHEQIPVKTEPNIQKEPEPQQTQTLEQQTGFIEQKKKQQYELIGQYKKTYLLLEQDSGLFLIDQHAAHERILYEQFIAQHGHIAKVNLLFPQVINLHRNETETICKHIKLFAQYGIEFEQFGDDKIKVQATPVSLKNVALDEIIKQAALWIDELSHSDTKEFKQAMQKKLYADMACKAAVKAGDTLSREQMQQLLRDLEKTDHRFSCPHGRPTSWLLHHDEIKKKFKRDYRAQKSSYM